MSTISTTYFVVCERLTLMSAVVRVGFGSMKGEFQHTCH